MLVDSPRSGVNLRYLAVFANHKPVVPAHPVITTAHAEVVAWQRSSSLVCRSMDQIQNVLLVMASKPWLTEVTPYSQSQLPITAEASRL